MRVANSHSHETVTHKRYLAWRTLPTHQAFHPMMHNTAFFRVMAIPACLVWGVLEFVALQRARLQGKRNHILDPVTPSAG